MSAADFHRPRALLAGLALLACSGGDDVDCKMVTAMGAPPAGAELMSLDSQQRSQLCDFMACTNGGYGAQGKCASGPSVMFAGSRGQCLGQWPTNPLCRATVRNLMDCVAAVRTDPCPGTLLFSPACSALTEFECITFKPNAALPGMAGF